MIVIQATSNGWILRHEASYISVEEISRIKSFHSDHGLMEHLKKIFDSKARDAKGKFKVKDK